VAILNYDDPLVRQMASKTSASIFYYGLEPEADLWADQIEGLGLEGIRFRLHHQNETIHLRVPLIGRHSVQTALRAAAVGLVEDLTWDEIVTGLQHGRNQLRMVAVNTENGALVLDDTYNASPESTLAALNLLEEMNGRKIAVLGDMLELGPYEVTGHRMVGVRAAQVCDLLVGVGQRSQNTIQAALDSGMQPSRTYWTPDTQGATELLLKILHEGDVVLIKGSRGLQMEKIVYAIEASE
jgi:UDP-N-acetylmuramoyl-tripeptide--D-alanyl-D-alanine ligase